MLLPAQRNSSRDVASSLRNENIQVAAAAGPSSSPGKGIVHVSGKLAELYLPSFSHSEQSDVKFAIPQLFPFDQVQHWRSSVEAQVHSLEIDVHSCGPYGVTLPFIVQASIHLTSPKTSAHSLHLPSHSSSRPPQQASFHTSRTRSPCTRTAGRTSCPALSALCRSRSSLRTQCRDSSQTSRGACSCLCLHPLMLTQGSRGIARSCA